MKNRPGKIILVCLASVIGIAILVLMWNPYRTCMLLSLREYVHPTQALAIPLPQACSPSDQKPSARTLALIGTQAGHYHLLLQSIAVCRMSTAQPQAESEFAAAFFNMQGRQRWLPSYVGCCTYSFRRHFAVIVAENDSTGATVVAATLVQGRWDYVKFLRSHCDDKLRAWL